MDESTAPIMLTMKYGAQVTRKVEMMRPSVMAAFFSLNSFLHLRSACNCARNESLGTFKAVVDKPLKKAQHGVVINCVSLVL